MAQDKLRRQSYNNLGGVNEKVSDYTTDLHEFLELKNVDFDVPNSLSKRPGQTNMLLSGTTAPITGIHEFERLNGFSQVIVASGSGLFHMSGGALTELSGGYSSTEPWDFLTFSDWMWASNGETFLKYNGSSFMPYGLPAHPKPSGVTTEGTAGATLYYFNPGVRYLFTYLNDRGYAGPADLDSVHGIAFSTESQGASKIVVQGLTAPSTHGISAILVWRSAFIENTNGFGQDRAPDNIPYYLLDTIDPGSTQYVDLHGNTDISINGITTLSNFFGHTLAPKYLELHNNALFMGHFEGKESSMRFSPRGEPERQEPEWQFEVRTNDGDTLTGMKSFSGDLLIGFKERSFHKVIGDDPTNYELIEISTEYGLISNDAVVVLDGRMLFLDRKGVVNYNGSSWSIISDRKEKTFRRMNVSAAKNKAVAVHYQARNQVWFSFPIDNSTENNVTVVYDYLVEAWTEFDGFTPSAFQVVKSVGVNRQTVFMGTPSGMITSFGESFMSDSGQGISCVIMPRFDAPDGRDVENLFRRYFLDVKKESGGTGVVDVEVFTNQDRDTVKATFSIYQNEFQTRRELGVPARSIAFKLSHFSATLPLEVKGWTVHRRFLRNV